MPDIGDVYYLSNAIFFGFDGNPLGITGPPDHYFVVYDIVGEICFAKELTSNSTCWHELSVAYKPITAPSDFFSTKSYYNNIHEDFCFCRSESSAFPLVTELMPAWEADPTLGPKAFTHSPRPYRTAGVKSIWSANMGPVIAKPAPSPGPVSLPTAPLTPTPTPPTAKDRFVAALSKGKT